MRNNENLRKRLIQIPNFNKVFFKENVMLRSYKNFVDINGRIPYAFECDTDKNL